MEPIYLSPQPPDATPGTPGNHGTPGAPKQASGSTNDPTAYTLSLTQAVLPDRANEIARVVARSPIDRLEHAYDFDDANAHLAWTVATNAQRKAAHLGYDPTQAGIESIVIGPSSRYGRLDEFFDGQNPMTPTRLVVYKQHQHIDDTPIREHLGPKHRDCFVGTPAYEQTARSTGRVFLDDLIKSYSAGPENFRGQIRQLLDDIHHPYAYSTGFVKGSLRVPTPQPTPRLEQIAQFELPEGYAREDFYEDVDAVQIMMKDMANQARSEASWHQYDVASQTYGYASELGDLFDHLCQGRHAQALSCMEAISPYLHNDLPYRLYEHLDSKYGAKPDPGSNA